MAYFISDEDDGKDYSDIANNRFLGSIFPGAKGGNDAKTTEEKSVEAEPSAILEAYPSQFGMIGDKLDSTDYNLGKTEQMKESEAITRLKYIGEKLQKSNTQVPIYTTNDPEHTSKVEAKTLDVKGSLISNPESEILNTIKTYYMNSDVLSEGQRVSSLTKIMLTCQQILKERYGIEE